MIRTNEVQGQQRRINDRENMTGYRRADIFMQRVGTVICSILIPICMISGIVKGVDAIIGVFKGKNNTNNQQSDYDSDSRQRYQKQQRW